MDPKPYAPPGQAKAPPGAGTPISEEKELAVMREIGRRRVRQSSLAFGLSWPAILLLLMFGVGLGLIPAGILSAALAAAFAKFFVKARKEQIIAAVLAEHGVAAGALDPAKYLVD